MGTDGHIFDAESKECLDFDRLFNLQIGVDWSGPTGDIWTRIEAGFPPRQYVTAAEVIQLGEAAVAAWGDDRHAANAQAVVDFARARPNGRFFIAHDHGYFATDSEIIDEEEYRRVEK